jgi:hypothetical protein
MVACGLGRWIVGSGGREGTGKGVTSCLDQAFVIQLSDDLVGSRLRTSGG